MSNYLDRLIKSIKKNIKKHFFLLDTASSIENIKISSSLILILKVIILLITASIIWMGFTYIDEVTVAEGEVIPKESISVIKHENIGVLSKTLVKNGDIVKKGQIIINMDATEEKIELNKIKTRVFILRINLKRLKQLLEYKEKVEFSNSEIKYNNEELKDINMQEKIKSATNFLKTQINDFKVQKNLILAKMQQKKLEINNINEQYNRQKIQLEYIQQELNMYESLSKADVGSKLEILQIKKRLNEAEAKLEQLNSDKQLLQQELKTLDLSVNELESTLMKNTQEDINKIEAELLETLQTKNKLTAKIEELSIKAPINGVVKGLNKNTGSVIIPGETILEIVPIDTELEVKIKVLPNDIANVHIGNKIKVKVSAYEYFKFGWIEGELVSLSANTFVDEDGAPYYEGIVKLDSQYINNNKDLKLIPGMLVQAEVVTGRKSILNYLLKPARITISESFSE